MGITGLLPFLDKAKTEINVRTLANKSVAIDTYCWWVYGIFQWSGRLDLISGSFFLLYRLHKGAFGVGDKLARGEKTDM